MRGKDASNVWFLLGLSAGVLLVRLLIFDFTEYFERHSIPNHDMYQGTGLFCPNMHSMRVSGDLAWWNPAGEEGGYAQYYNAFLSPLAPTNGHLVTIVWAQLVRVLACLGIALPEYLQYLLVNLVILPFLTYLALGYLALQLFRSRVSIALVLLIYAFSGLGLWNSAWFYYQEPATLFFWLGAFIAACRRPTVRRGAVLALALLVQLASCNYWSVYNSWFVLIFVGSYGVIYRNQLKRLAVRARDAVKLHPRTAAGLIAACTLVAAVWVSLLAVVVNEQAGKYARNPMHFGIRAPYTELKAYARVKELRRYTLELFNPKLARALSKYPFNEQRGNEMHQARYLGAVLLPLLAACWFIPGHRREAWLFTVAGLTFIVCLAPPWLLKVWSVMPLMGHIRHVFDFYSHHVQLMVLLVCTAVFDRVVSGRLSARSRQILGRVLTACLVIALAALAALGVFSDHFPADDPSLEALVLATLLGLLSAFLIRQCLISPATATRYVCCALLLVITAADECRYYWEVSRLDQQFTVRRYKPVVTPFPLPQATRTAFKTPWRMPQPGEDVGDAFFANMPVFNHLWPSNQFNPHRHVHDLRALPVEARQWRSDALLTMHAAVSHACEHGDMYEGAGSPDFRLISQRATYSEYEFEFHSPQAGTAVIGLLWDPYWRVTLDDQPVQTQRANVVGQSLAVPGGTHRLRLSYKPLSRALYWPACWLLEAAVAALATVAVVGRRTQIAGDRHHDKAQSPLAGPWYRRRRTAITSCRE